MVARPTPSAPLDARYRIESSQDLETWRVVGEGRLVDLTHAGHRIQQRRIATGAGASARYFRLFRIWFASGFPAFAAVLAIFWLMIVRLRMRFASPWPLLYYVLLVGFWRFFDGSFLNHDHFPADGSIYLFLWDPKSPGGKGLDVPIE